MDVDPLFINTLRDLEPRTTANDEYDVLMSAALLRKLLLDAGPLAIQANRRYRLRLRFRVNGVSPFEQRIHDSNPIFWTLEDGLDPDIAFANAAFDATLDQFLQRRVMRFDERWITVRDVIDQLANVEGAVHKGGPKDERDRTLQAAAKFYSRAGLPGVVGQVRLIGQITVRGLTPLRDAIVAANPMFASMPPS